MNEDFDIEKITKECDEIFDRFKKIEDDAIPNITKYFDRIHDKLFAYQLFFLAAYISLVAIPTISLSPWWLLIPIGCIARLIWIDYKMMEYNRTLSNITKISTEKREKITKTIQNINTFSLEVIFESVILTVFFMIFLIYRN